MSYSFAVKISDSFGALGVTQGTLGHLGTSGATCHRNCPRHSEGHTPTSLGWEHIAMVPLVLRPFDAPSANTHREPIALSYSLVVINIPQSGKTCKKAPMPTPKM